MIIRKLLKQLDEHLLRKEISLIIGPRQAGKTTLMRFMKKRLDEQGTPTLFLNLDIEADQRHFVSQEVFLQKIRLEIGDRKGYIFIDEIQRKENAGLFLKGLQDMDLPHKFVVSGSGSLELKEKIHESLVGRKRIFELNPLSFGELADHRTQSRYEERLSEYLRLEPEKTNLLLNEYLAFGGYPRVVLAATSAEKQMEMAEIYQSYLEKDIAYFLQLKKTESLSKLIKALAARPGGLVNISKLSSELGIAAQTVKDYLWYLEKTFIIRKATPFFGNIRKEIRKAPLCYFYDLGLRNYAAGAFGRSDTREEGFLFQNLVFNDMKDALASTSVGIHFWRTADQAEVDFILDCGRERIPVEVKDSELKKPSVPRGLRGFILRYKPARAYLVNRSLRDTIEIDGTKLVFLPFYEWPEELTALVHSR